MEMIEISKEDHIESAPNSENGNILKPGAKIKPETTIEDAEKLVQRLYGITTREVQELNSYDDRNYIIKVDSNIKNPLITNCWPHGYILKILNALDSKKMSFIDAQTQLMLFLRNQNITCSKPVKNVYGNYYSLENIDGSKHVVRLLEFIPDKIFCNVPKNNFLFYQVGEFVAKLDVALKKFQHDAYNSHKSLWMLSSVPKLKEFLYVLQDIDRKEMVEQIIEAFESRVLPNVETLEKSIIHGDFNEQNILVAELKDGKEFRVSGILDFGDTCNSPLVFELAIAMAYMMLQSKDLATGGLVIAGYSSVRHIPENEVKILKECVAGRLCQSLVLGAYSHSLDPENEYLLVTQKNGWELLESLWKDNYSKIDEIWAEVADNYLKQSVK